VSSYLDSSFYLVDVTFLIAVMICIYKKNQKMMQEVFKHRKYLSFVFSLCDCVTGRMQE
jgi:hypothetical protein